MLFTLEIDDKFMLHELYKNNTTIEKVFPKTYGSIQEALDSTLKNDHDKN